MVSHHWEILDENVIIRSPLADRNHEICRNGGTIRTLRPCAVTSSVLEWGCARSNHRRIRGKLLGSPGQPWERRPATRGFACRRIPSLLKSKRTQSVVQRLVRGALAHSFALCAAPNLRENHVPSESRHPATADELGSHASLKWQTRIDLAWPQGQVECEIMPKLREPVVSLERFKCFSSRTRLCLVYSSWLFHTRRRANGGRVNVLNVHECEFCLLVQVCFAWRCVDEYLRLIGCVVIAFGITRSGGGGDLKRCYVRIKTFDSNIIVFNLNSRDMRNVLFMHNIVYVR